MFYPYYYTVQQFDLLSRLFYENNKYKQNLHSSLSESIAGKYVVNFSKNRSLRDCFT